MDEVYVYTRESFIADILLAMTFLLGRNYKLSGEAPL
jgi:hypothetical protein